jgi:stage V sporulation protein G
MDITEVKVFPIQEEKLKAFVSIVFDQCFMVNDIKIIQGRDGLFISMPSRKKKNGEFKDVAHPLNNETRRMIEEKVLGEYERVLDERGERLPAAPSTPSATGAAARGHAGAPEVSASPALDPAGRGESPARAAEAAGAGAGGSGPGPAGDAVGGAATPPAGVPGSSSGPSDPSSGQEASSAEKSLDEIEELHLRDSFWTAT